MNSGIFSAIILPVTIAIVTLGLGLSITVTDLRKIFFNPWGITVGLLSQLILLPLIAFAIAVITRLPAEWAVGLVLVASCPGGATSNLVNYMIRNNVALSLSITVVNGIITIFTIPLLTRISLEFFLHQDAMINLPFLDTVYKIFLLTVLPASTGILIRYYWEVFALRLENPLRYILPVLLLLVYSGVVFLEGENGSLDVQRFLSIIPYVLALNLLSMFAGLYVPRLAGLVKRDQVTISVEVGLQNSSLAIFVAGTLLNNYTIAMIAVVYGSFSFFTTWAFGYLAKRYL